MAMVKWDPLQELLSMQEQMNRLFELSRSRLYAEPLEDRGWQPAVDIYEDPEAVVVKMEVPEVDLEDVQITVENQTLTIQGVRQLKPSQPPPNYLRMERCYGQFRRLFALPPDLDQERISISCDRGVLQIVLPKNAGSGEEGREG
ncbi:MAG: Hsp20/alpha crystallin family protein [Desulfuromonadales bacterium]|nr:Hsp20/alpha crystallin family protein [Desulfuromonadales bacterium]